MEKRSYKNFNELAHFLIDLEEADEWRIVNFTDCELSVHNGNYFLTSREEKEFVNEGAFFTLKKRLGLTGEAFSYLLDNALHDEVCTFVNTMFNALPEEPDGNALTLKRDGEIIAMHSLSYSHIPQYQIFQVANDFISETYKAAVFKSAFFDLESTIAQWKISTGEIIEEYKKAIKKAGFDPYILANSQLLITTITGDTGIQSVTFYAELLSGGNRFPLGSKLTIKHDRNNDIDKVQKEIRKLTAKVSQEVDLLKKLATIEIQFPIEVFVRAVRSIKIPAGKKAFNNILSKYVVEKQKTPKATAFEIVAWINSIKDTNDFDKLTRSSKLTILENLYRISHFDWSAADKKGDRVL